MKNATIFWCTGLSGAGKTTLSLHVKKRLEAIGFSVKILDGDTGICLGKPVFFIQKMILGIKCLVEVGFIRLIIKIYPLS